MNNYFIRKKIKKRNNKYSYKYYTKDNKSISYKSINKYLKHIYIPPGYDNVKINKNKNEDILAIGYDDKQRSQYIYNKQFVEDSANIKFYKLIDFGMNYNYIIKQINKDINSKVNSKNKEIAIILSIIDNCNFRIGNDKYMKDNNSYGVSTLQQKHIKTNKNEMVIDFIGKKGVRNKCSIKNKKIVNHIKSKRNRNKNDRIFKYSNGKHYKHVTSKDVNDYLKQFGDYSTKNFRTWRSNIEFINIVNKHKTLKINDCIKLVSNKLHHTQSICKKNYLEPKLLDFYKNDPIKFQNYFKGNINQKFINFLKLKYE